MTCIVFLFNFNFSLIFCHHVSHLTAHFQSFSQHLLPPPDYFPLRLVIPPLPLSLLDDPVALRALVLAFPILIFLCFSCFWSFYLAVNYDRLFGFFAFPTELSLDFISFASGVCIWVWPHLLLAHRTWQFWFFRSRFLHQEFWTLSWIEGIF